MKLACAIFALLLTLTGCQSVFVPSNLSLEDSILASINDPNNIETISNLVIINQRPLDQDRIVIFSYDSHQNDGELAYNLGYAQINKKSNLWDIKRMKSFGGFPRPKLLAYQQTNMEDNTVIYGQVTGDANITSVSVTSTSKAIANDFISDGVFFIRMPNLDKLQQIDFKDSNGNIIYSSTAAKVIR